MVKQTLNGISFEMTEMHDFSFLDRYGKVFRVFDDQDSGNICFGVKDGKGIRRFVKYAGAMTKRSSITPQQAVENLRKTEVLYRDLAHPVLIHLQEVFDTQAGFGMVFDWEDGDCMGRMYPEAHARFCAFPAEDHLQVFEDVADFLAHTAKNGYVAVDFYDGSVMYDSVRKKTTVCDIDFFRKGPFVNDMGRMWGSSRFMSPEEFELGERIDEVTNVYTLGAFAFALFGNYSRARSDWTLSEKKYQVAERAVSDDRPLRQQSIEQFLSEWHSAE